MSSLSLKYLSSCLPLIDHVASPTKPFVWAGDIQVHQVLCIHSKLPRKKAAIQKMSISGSDCRNRQIKIATVEI
jgi:hypothetical protein